MVKLVGSACILAGGFLARRTRLAALRRRREALRDLGAVLRRMAEAIRMARLPLPGLLSSLAPLCGGDVAAFLTGGAEAARRGGDLRGAWRRLAGELPLSEGDRAVVAALGDDLQGDEEQVCRALALAASELERSRERLEQDRQAEEKRTTALCFSSAALLVILLI